MIVRLFDHPRYAIFSPRYSNALRFTAKSVPGMRWEAAHSSWVGYPCAVEQVLKKLAEQGVRADGELCAKRIYVKVKPAIKIGLREYQTEAVRFIVANAAEGVLCADDMGLGKTLTAIRSAKALRAPSIVVCPSFVRMVWRRELEKWRPKAHIIELWGVKPKEQQIAELKLAVARYGGKLVVLVHYDIVHAWVKPLIEVVKQQPATIIFDECFPAGTKVETPTGLKSIESFRPGDAIECAVGVGRVQEVGYRDVPLAALRIVQLEDGREFICTASHPILALRPLSEMPHWRAAGDLLPGSFILDVMHTRAVHEWGEQRRANSQVPRADEGHEAMQALFAGRVDEARSLLLLSVLRREMESEALPCGDAGGAYEALVLESAVERFETSARTKAGMGGGVERAHADAQPDALSGDAEESVGDASSLRASAEDSRRQRPNHALRAASAAGVGVAVASASGEHRQPASEGFAVELQDRLGAPQAANRNRGRWPEPQFAVAASGRSAERPLPSFARVVRVAVPQRADFERLGLGGPDDQGDVPVYNLEVDRHPSYVVAGGVVAHNCHYLQSDRSRRSGACRDLARACSYRIGLSGTPMTSRPRDLWNPVETLSPGRFGRPFDFYLAHADAKQETISLQSGPKTIWKTDGASRLEELRERLSWFMIRRTKSEVELELPPRTRQIIELEVARSHQRFEMGAADKSHNKTLMREALSHAADGKLPKVLEMVQSHLADGSKVVIFCHRVVIAQALSASFVAEGVDSKFIVGDIPMSKREEIIDSQPSVLCATMDSTQAGIDLTYANVALFVELDWVPSKLLQCEARLDRFGQKRNVLIQYLIALSTADEIIASAVIDKLGNFEAAIGKTDDKLRSDLGGTQKTAEQHLSNLALKLRRMFGEGDKCT